MSYTDALYGGYNQENHGYLSWRPQAPWVERDLTEISAAVGELPPGEHLGPTHPLMQRCATQYTYDGLSNLLAATMSDAQLNELKDMDSAITPLLPDDPDALRRDPRPLHEMRNTLANLTHIACAAGGAESIRADRARAAQKGITEIKLAIRDSLGASETIIGTSFQRFDEL